MIQTCNPQISECVCSAAICASRDLMDQGFTSMSEPADLTLIKAALDGDRTAFAELIERYRAAIFRTVRRTLGRTEEHEDAVQEVFIRALIKLPQYDQRYPFAPWILKITSNYCIDQLRRMKARKYKLWSDLSEAEEARISRKMCAHPETEDLLCAEKNEYLKIAQSLLNKLKPVRRMAFVLREIEGRDYSEVATILGVPEVTVRVRVWRARNDLNNEFRKYLIRRGQR
jgi:RNA polymerase sigma-70 factor, ECF subfamily